MFNTTRTARLRFSVSLVGVVALALFTACSTQEPAQDDPTADQDTQESPAPTGEGPSDNTPDDGTDEAAADNDEVYKVIDAVEAEYADGIIISIELENQGSLYDVDVVSDDTVDELDVTPDGDVSLDETESDDDDIRDAEQANVTVAEALDQAFDEHPDADFDEIELDEDDDNLHWEVELLDNNGAEIELEISAS
ncbi:MAG TPA: PepSY domain-containing protein [Candidatus Yaniella excrementigallinarum]|nr:PepSY domain-containing protein [Candidatus Yaniella excrementigallinarum]